MVWIKFAHTGGTAIINLEQTYSIERSGILTLDFIDPTTNSTTYTFTSSDEVTALLNKLIRVARVIDIDRLADQE